MQLPEELAGSGLGGWLGALAATIVGGGLMLRRWLSRDSVERAGDEARVEVIQMLTEQLAAERARADKFAEDRNAAYGVIAEMRERIARLETRLEHLEGKNANPNP